MEFISFHLEVEAHLVMATVFKTAELGVNRPVGGFDSHTLPLFILSSMRPNIANRRS